MNAGYERFGIVVTRPGAPGSALVADLVGRGAAAVAAPAFTLGPPPDEAATARVLARLGEFDVAVFVSPAAVRAVAARLPSDWPASCAIASVGAATARAIERDLRGATAARRIAPDGAPDEAGSEALWAALHPWLAATPVRRVLLLRAESGRDWLAERLAGAGMQVEVHAAYSRRAAVPDAVALAAMRTWHRGRRRAVLVVTSSEAIDVIGARWAAHAGVVAGGVRPWLRDAIVVATHRRIAGRAQAARYADVRIAAPEADHVLAALAAPLESQRLDDT